MNKPLQHIVILLIVSLLSFNVIGAQSNHKQQTAVRKGAYIGIQFGYLYTDYGSDLDMYTPGIQSTVPDGTYFSFRPEIGYNFTKMLGLELGGMKITDSGQSTTKDPVQKASLSVSNIDLLAVIHLPLDKSGDWVATPKVGFSIMSASLNYHFSSTKGKHSPWGGGTSVDETSKKTLLAPSVGLEFEHSYNRHWIMTFSYQYYYSDYTNFKDPYFIPVSTLGLFSTGIMYKF